jgi:hypothetical protein
MLRYALIACLFLLVPILAIIFRMISNTESETFPCFGSFYAHIYYKSSPAGLDF